MRGTHVKTYSAKPGETAPTWYVVDATDKPLGRLASEVARRLRGKHRPEFTPHVDLGDRIIVVNASGVRIAGNKRRDKTYYHHTGYPGGLKAISFDRLHKAHPQRVIELAVRGMLPKGRLGRAMFRKLRVYPGAEHAHAAQQPIAFDI